MHQVITVHADAELVLGSDFADQLAAIGAAALQGVPELKVSKGVRQTYSLEARDFVPASPWEDRTAEFLSGTAQISGTQVLWTKAQRAAGEQAAGTYVVWCRVQTDTGPYLVDTWYLEVVDDGSVPS